MAPSDQTDAVRSALGFDAVDFSTIGEPPAPRVWAARDGETLCRRGYGLDGARTALVFIHGSSGEDAYLAPLGRTVVARAGIAMVAPTLRGHGATPRRRGDIDRPDQLLDDIEDLIAHLRDDHGVTRILLGGHSSGGGLALKYGLERGARGIDGLVLVAPYIHHRAASARPNAGGWARVNVPRLLLLSLLAALGITRFGHRNVVRFSVPPELRRQSTTDAYSYLMLSSMSPRDGYARRLARLAVPVAVIAGAKDGAFRADKYAEVFAPAPDARVEIVDGVGHMDVAMQPPGIERIADAVKTLVER